MLLDAQYSISATYIQEIVPSTTRYRYVIGFPGLENIGVPLVRTTIGELSFMLARGIYGAINEKLQKGKTSGDQMTAAQIAVQNLPIFLLHATCGFPQQRFRGVGRNG